MHNFHIPVMGIGYTIDTPVRVAHLGISSVISLLDDILIEKMRKFYCDTLGFTYNEITDKFEDHRAKRITDYLNKIQIIVKEKIERLKIQLSESMPDLEKYVAMLPDVSPLKKQFTQCFSNGNHEDLQKLINEIPVGDIDVNIMTKLDKTNYSKGVMQSVEFNDAHAALRGFANSDLHSSVVLSAGMNPRLYSYFEHFSDFYPDENGYLKKRIILKVSDYRSAAIQGKFFAKKGLWVSEYRVESGLNCGGHAFPTQGYLLGPILEEFKTNRKDLVESAFSLYSAALKKKNIQSPSVPPQVKITAQGGVGTHLEHNFLLNYYQIDSVGWGSPFLLVPEVSNVDLHTLSLLQKAKDSDLYLSDTSPLGVPFNTLKNNTKDLEKQDKIDHGTPGSACPKQYGALNEERQCTGSRAYQRQKIKELDAMKLSPEEYKIAFDKITVKSCICVGLGTSVLLVNHLDMKAEGTAVSVCPGPNMAYFNKVVPLKTMVDHIYGRANLIDDDTRQNLFVNEIKLYINFLIQEMEKSAKPISAKQVDYYNEFQHNLIAGVDYYLSLAKKDEANALQFNVSDLERFKEQLTEIQIH